MLGTVTNVGASFVEMGKYVIKLVRMEDEGQSQFKEEDRRIKWTFHLADASVNPPTVLLGSSGDPYEFFAWTNEKMGPATYARKWTEALLGRALLEGADGADIAAELIGKKAVALIGPNKNGRMSILQVDPITALKKPAAKPVVALEPVGAGAETSGDDGF